MALTLQQVEHIAELAKLALTPAEKEQYREQLSAILEYAGVLQSLNTDSIPPTASVLPLQNIMAEDEVEPSLPVEEVLANAPHVQANCLRVRAILNLNESSA